MRAYNAKKRMIYHLQIAHKILNDEFAVANEAGEVVLHPASKRGKKAISSVTDPEATIRHHGQNSTYGYNTAVAIAPDRLIAEIQAFTGCEADTAALPALLTAQKENLPEVLVFDQIAGTGKAVAEVAKASNGRTQLVAKPMPYKERTARFSPTDFSVSNNGHTLTCPNGRCSSRQYRSGEGEGVHFRFMPAQCLGCPLLKQCRGPDKPPTVPRNVFLNDHAQAYAQLVSASQTAEFREALKLRPRMEQVIASLVRYNGARQVRVRGLAKVDFQMKMCAVGYNLKRWLKLDDLQSIVTPRAHCAKVLRKGG